MGAPSGLIGGRSARGLWRELVVISIANSLGVYLEAMAGSWYRFMQGSVRLRKMAKPPRRNPMLQMRS